MAKLVKIVDNKYVQIEEYKNPNICFNTNEYSDFEDYRILRETFDPFRMFYENKELKSELELYKNGVYFSSEVDEKDKQIDKLKAQQKEFIKYLEDEIQQQETVIAENQEKLYFFKYEDEKEDLKLSSRKAYIKRIIFEEILQKYKSIIGLNNE